MNKKEELNELVIKYKNDIEQGAKGNKIRYFEKIYDMIIELTPPKFKTDPTFNDALNSAVMKSIKAYDAQKGDFINFFSRVLKNAEKDEIKFYAKNIRDLRLDDNTFDEGNSDLYDKIVDESGYCTPCDSIYPLVLDIVKARQRELKNSPKICWATYFFTENIAEAVSTNDNNYRQISSERNKYLSAMSLDFLNSFVTKECSDIPDIRNSRLLPKAHFIDGGQDAPCGYPLIEEVYAKYTGKTKSAVSQNKKDYYKLLKPILKYL